MQSLWQSCLVRLEKELPAQQFNTWIRPLNADPRATDVLRLVAPNRFVLQWVKDRFLRRIEALASEPSGTPVRVALALPDVSDLPEPAPPPPPARPLATTPGAKAPGPERKAADRPSLASEFTFDNFVPGKANQLARAAAMQVAENPGTSYNPLFV